MRQIHSSEDARFLTRQRLPWMVFDYFDGAAGEGWGGSAKSNRDSIDTVKAKVALPI
jgi:L-lactate dehydrogenase (cytochrome)